MTKETMKLYKLMTLYFLKKSGKEMPNAIISDFFLSYGYTDYFSIQLTLSYLTDDKQITRTQTYKTAYYNITSEGLQTLDFFENELPEGTPEHIDEYLSTNKIKIQRSLSVYTDYTMINKREYLTKCCLKERNTELMEIKLSVPNEEYAIKICENFKIQQEEIYQSLMGKLLQDEMKGTPNNHSE